MRVDVFSYALDPDRIAQHPAAEREAARLLVLGPGSGPPSDRTIADLPDLVPEGALVVVNDTRVLPARLLGTKRGTGGRVEIFLVRKQGEAEGLQTLAPGSPGQESREIWSALGRASKGLKAGTIVDVGPLEVHILATRQAQDELLTVALQTTDGSSAIDAVRRFGHVPLPPYIRRDAVADPSARDAEQADAVRYQTMFARVEGAVAAPTAGLHLTEALVGRLRARGCTIATVTLHVGLGTFQPVSAEDLDQHFMHAEWFDVPAETARAVDAARGRGAAVVAVGTTVVRALESAAGADVGPGRVRAGSGDTRLLIQPGYRFQVVDVLLTNLHLPRSTLLALVCAFAGTERVLDAYRRAHEARYRFFSYGDAMLLWRQA
jgi:S-adenosylmethionine:tRNA ribosyltransferase-isomerase